MTELKNSEFPRDSAEYILSVFSSQSFWNLNHDSLNLKGVAINDSTNTMMDISDGANEKFEILDKDGFSIIESYMPDAYLTKFPSMATRRKFVVCRNTYLSIWKQPRS